MLAAPASLRLGESYLPSNCARTKRIMHLGADWYFLTRESNTPLGPYSSRKEAIRAANEYVEFASVAGNQLTSRCYEYLSQAG